MENQKMPTTIKTRYRDIPYEEIGHAANIGESLDEGGAGWENWRGKPVEIETPPFSASDAHCNQPLFWIVDRGERTNEAVCGHLVEVGD